ncbi:MAG: hypothetical protein E4H23_11765 [Chrysiogenales bacterium]|jgi:hypothetical protein|nr:MAG: hypothetical protein E4H23_11765 [Chrysiogenales bacterium]
MKPKSPEIVKAVAIQWVQAGIGAGLATCIVYPLVTMAPLPRVLLVVLASALGPTLAVASLGLRQALRLHEETVVGDLGALFNVLAGVLLEAMLLVQLAIRLRASGEASAQQIAGVWLGLDVAWDVYIGLGTGCFAIAMLRHPRFGKAMGIAGLVLAAAVLGFNLFTFPIPPAEAGLLDVGPAIGLWYLVATILMWRSMSWLKDTARERD